ncbi:hypothetical protein B0J13DRAFT_602590 [Dactylonectria estremocensis]|uniref:Uncharacterized protein n=1 Tax=Dactylonectria estremocensis TaxID=1079267 RepID=A0A9P9JB08_9HYPO|nr:hypothetical protein B0J13DRAFT_602590 [Dactylonectria estremocensis]
MPAQAGWAPTVTVAAAGTDGNRAKALSRLGDRERHPSAQTYKETAPGPVRETSAQPVREMSQPESPTDSGQSLDGISGLREYVGVGIDERSLVDIYRPTRG